jgi:hypothetical protein
MRRNTASPIAPYGPKLVRWGPPKGDPPSFEGVTVCLRETALQLCAGSVVPEMSFY